MPRLQGFTAVKNVISDLVEARQIFSDELANKRQVIGTSIDISTSNVTLTENQAGITFFLTDSGGSPALLLLPDNPTTGTTFKFIYNDSSSPTENIHIDNASVSVNYFSGTISTGDNSGSTTDGLNDFIIFRTTAVRGDWVECLFNGSIYIVKGSCNVSTGVAITTV